MLSVSTVNRMKFLENKFRQYENREKPEKSEEKKWNLVEQALARLESFNANSPLKTALKSEISEGM